MFIYKSKILNRFPNIMFGFSTKIGLDKNEPFNFNMSNSIGDNKKTVMNNRISFFSSLGLNLKNVIIQKQTHSAIVNVVQKFTNNLEGDALITGESNLGLAISTADCTNIYLYDYEQNIIAAVHSGWEGTEKRILEKTLEKLKDEFYCNPKNLFVCFGPSISQKNYEVGKEFADKFDEKYLIPKGEKFLLDLKSANKDMLLDAGVPGNQIEISDICSYENNNFHSYRRDKQNSGRALGVIAIKGENE